MAAATQGTYINPMAALATQMPHAAAPLANGITSPVVPPTSGNLHAFYWLSSFQLNSFILNLKPIGVFEKRR